MDFLRPLIEIHLKTDFEGKMRQGQFDIFKVTFAVMAAVDLEVIAWIGVTIGHGMLQVMHHPLGPIGEYTLTGGAKVNNGMQRHSMAGAQVVQEVVPGVQLLVTNLRVLRAVSDDGGHDGRFFLIKVTTVILQRERRGKLKLEGGPRTLTRNFPFKPSAIN